MAVAGLLNNTRFQSRFWTELQIRDKRALIIGYNMSVARVDSVMFFKL